MPRNNRPIIIGAAVLGALALGLTMLMLMRGGGSPPPPGPAPVKPVIKQIVAARAIPPRTLITREMLREETTEKLAPGAVTNVNDAVGKLTTSQINSGAPIETTLYSTPLRRVIPANFAVPEGLRGVAVFVDPNSTAAGLVDAGDHVDVVVNHKGRLIKSDTETTEQIISGPLEIVTGRTIAQDLLVLAVDKSLQAPAPTPIPPPGQPAAAGAPAPPPTPPPAPTPAGQVVKTRVLLAATPQVAERLVAANDSGTLHLLIRNPNSRERVTVAAATEYPTTTRTIPKASYFDKRRAEAQANREKQARLQLDAIKEMRESSRQDRLSTASGRNDNPPTFTGTPPSFPTPLPPFRANTNNNPPRDYTLPRPAAPSGSEVTVIRGTEKTRVIVPAR